MYWISKLATRTDEKHFGGWLIVLIALKVGDRHQVMYLGALANRKEVRTWKH